MFREVPKPVTVAEIREIIDGYAIVAGHCRQGGFDGVELQCSHSSIVRGFLSGATNLRSDSYGGSLAGRARFLLEVLAAVRAAIGPGMALGVRLCGDELMAGGITLDQATGVAKMVEDSGHADYINTSIGVATASLYMIEASMAVPPGYALFIPSAIRKTVRLPVIGVGRFKDPIQAERALADGHADLIGIVRGQIADPDFAAKARSDHADDIRLCLSCNQECVGRMGLGRWLGCIENPRAGREAEPLRRPAVRPRRVMVAGGGPGGLQAAISAARRGHEVSVYERDDDLGGQVRIAARAPGRAEFGDLVRNQLAECRRAGVAIKTGVLVDVDVVRAERPDVVVVATGARPASPFWVTANPPAGGPEICDVRDVLDGSAHPRGRVLVVDDLGFHQATSTAEVLADSGCEVEVTTSGMMAGQDLGITLDMETWWIRATRKGIAQTTDTLVTGIVPGGVTTQHLATGAVGRRSADWVVLAAQQAPVDELYFALKELRRSWVAPRCTGWVTAWPRAGRTPLSSTATGSGNCCESAEMIAVVPVRMGVLPPGADEAAAECRGDVLLIGSGTDEAAAALQVAASQVRTAEVGAYAPAGWAEALAPLLAQDDLVVLPASADGRDLAPRLAVAMGRPLWAGAVAVIPGRITVARYDGQVLVEADIDRPAVVTLLPGVAGVEPASAGTARCEQLARRTARAGAHPAGPARRRGGRTDRADSRDDRSGRGTAGVRRRCRTIPRGGVRPVHRSSGTRGCLAGRDQGRGGHRLGTVQPPDRHDGGHSAPEAIRRVRRVGRGAAHRGHWRTQPRDIGEHRPELPDDGDRRPRRRGGCSCRAT